MRRSILTIAAIAASVFVLGKADAMPLNGGLGDAADRLSAVEKTQFVYLGRNYCWYPDGWHGPASTGAAMLGAPASAGAVRSAGMDGAVAARRPALRRSAACAWLAPRGGRAWVRPRMGGAAWA
jgi:hypothetical protein